MEPEKQLAALNRGFRSGYLPYDELMAQLAGWAETFPTLVRIDTLGRTDENRAIPLLVVGKDPDRARPTAWIDGNMHAVEVAGSSVCLSVAEDVIALHLAESEPTGRAHLDSIPAHVRSILTEIRFFIVPRISPDGAEAVLTTGQYVRSVPRDRRTYKAHPRWVAKDIDGDGLALVMRKEDPTGEFIESRDVAGLLLPRRLEDEGPFYKVYPEGVIEHWDGTTIPNPSFLSDNDTDLNRNFPYTWAPEPEQIGAGSYPLSETESRAIVEVTTKHPEIFAWLNLHTFGGVFIRPLGDKPDNKMNPADLELFRQLGAWAEELTGYPMVSGFEEFTYEPDKPLHGDLSDYAFHQRGAVAFVCEIWDLFRRIGMERKKRFVDHYKELTREDRIRLGTWDREENDGAVLKPWKKHHHPQLGEVEVGGLDPRFGLWNPTKKELPRVCEGLSAFFLRLAALAPRIVVEPKVEPMGDGTHAVTVTVENRGYLPTYVVATAKDRPFNEPLYIDLETEACTLVDPADRHLAIGHLEGWGRGLYPDGGSLFFLRSRGTTSRAVRRIIVRGSGELQVTAGSSRVGWQHLRLTIG